MYYNCFICSSVDGYLGCFHVLAVVNSAAVNSGIHVSFSVLVAQGICLVVVFLGHMVVLFLLFKGISILFSIMVVSVYIPTNSVGGFPFLHSLSSIYCLFSSVQSLSHVRIFVTPWTAARQASLSITKSQSILKLIDFSIWPF